MALFTDPDGNDLMLHHRYAPATGPQRRGPRGAPEAPAASSSRISFGSMKRTSSWTVRSSPTSWHRARGRRSTRRSTSSSGALAPEVMPTVSTPSSHSSAHLDVVVDQVRGGAVFPRNLDQAVGVGGVGRADHQHQVALAGELLDGDLAIGGRVTDVVGLGGDDRGKLRRRAAMISAVSSTDRVVWVMNATLSGRAPRASRPPRRFRSGRLSGASPVVPSTSSWPSWPIITIV